jgi:MYXO-CTERM domain-containing protein
MVGMIGVVLHGLTWLSMVAQQHARWVVLWFAALLVLGGVVRTCTRRRRAHR